MDQSAQMEAVKRTYGRGRALRVWTEKRDQGLRPHELALVRNQLKDRNAAILNIGCGSGRETFALYEMGFQDVTSVDLSPELLQAAIDRCRRDNLPIAFSQASCSSLPFDNEAFDAATMFFNIYGHIVPRTARVEALVEARRILKPGGLLLLDVNSFYLTFPHWAMNCCRDIIRRCYNPGQWEPGDKKWSTQIHNKLEKRNQVACSHVFRKNEIPQLAQATGFKVVQSTTYKDIIKDQAAASKRFMGKGVLVYALQRAG